MDGLPPLPKSLSGLLNFSRESLSRAEATLGLRANGVTSTPTPPKTNVNKPPLPASSNAPALQKQQPLR